MDNRLIRRPTQRGADGLKRISAFHDIDFPSNQLRARIAIHCTPAAAHASRWAAGAILFIYRKNGELF